MTSICNFEFYGYNKIDDNIEEVKFNARGYEKIDGDKIIYYFKDKLSYKFILINDVIEVSVNESKYIFNLNKKTEALIVSDAYNFKASINTSKLNVSEDLIELEYSLSFNGFKGEYKITLKLLKQ